MRSVTSWLAYSIGSSFKLASRDDSSGNYRRQLGVGTVTAMSAFRESQSFFVIGNILLEKFHPVLRAGKIIHDRIEISTRGFQPGPYKQEPTQLFGKQKVS